MEVEDWVETLGDASGLIRRDVPPVFSLPINKEGGRNSCR